jgi:hypothetical protein
LGFLVVGFLVEVDLVPEDVDELAAGALAEEPVELGVSAAMAAAAIPKDNRAEAINLIMGSPAKGVDERSTQRIRPI